MTDTDAVGGTVPVDCDGRDGRDSRDGHSGGHR